jgi:hypothetical protein
MGNRSQVLLALGIVLALTVEALAVEASRLTIGLNFTGNTLFVDSLSIPPTRWARWVQTTLWNSSMVGTRFIANMMASACRPAHWTSSGPMPESAFKTSHLTRESSTTL